MQTFHELGIPNLGMLTTDNRPQFSFNLYRQLLPYVEQTEYGQTLTKKLNDDPRVKAIEGQLLTKGASRGQIQVHHLALWFLWSAKSNGEHRTWEILNEWLDAEDIELLNTLWVIGLEVDSTLTLDDRFSITHIRDMPDSDDKENYLTVSRDRLSFGPQDLPVCAITEKIKARKLYKNDHDKKSGQAQFQERTKDLFDIAAILNAINGTVCVPYCHTCYLPEYQPPGIFGFSGSSSPILDVSTNRIGKITADSIPLLNGLLKSFAKVGQNEQDRIRLILSRLSQAKRRTQAADKLLDLGIALEMLLLDDNQKDQLSLQFRLRGSWLVGSTATERVEKYELLQDIYGARSAVAHTGHLPKKGGINEHNLQEMFPKCEKLSEEIAQRIIFSGKPNWQNLVLGA